MDKMVDLNEEPTSEAENEESAPSEEVVDTEQAEEGAEAVAAEDGAETPKDEGAEPKSAKGSPGAEKRIKQLGAQAKAFKEEAAYWQGVAEGNTKKEPTPEQDRQAGIVLPPVLEKFDTFLAQNPNATYEDFQDARQDYRYEQREIMRAEKARRTTAAERYEAEFKRAEQTFEDFGEVVGPTIRDYTTVMAEAIIESDVGPEIQYHLAKNPAELKEIRGLNPLATARAIGRIEAKILARKGKPPEGGKQISQAPKPLDTVDGKGKVVTDPTTIPMSEFARQRNEAQYGKKG